MDDELNNQEETSISDYMYDDEEEGYFAEDIDEPNPEIFERSGEAKAKSKSSFGYKSVGILAVAILVGLSLIFMVVDRTSIRKKPVPQQQVVQKQEQPVAPQQKQQGGTQSGLKALPPDIVLDYTGDVLETKGTVHNKLKFVDGDVVVYCIQINANIGGKNKVLSYYCGYNTFNSVDTGDSVGVSYQYVNQSNYSVNTITK